MMEKSELLQVGEKRKSGLWRQDKPQERMDPYMHLKC